VLVDVAGANVGVGGSVVDVGGKDVAVAGADVEVAGKLVASGTTVVDWVEVHWVSSKKANAPINNNALERILIFYPLCLANA
jgi:hypothetical protein